jgi:hypothetical protein
MNAPASANENASKTAWRAPGGAILAPLAVVVAVAMTISVGGEAPKTAPVRQAAAPAAIDPAGESTSAFIQSVALTHVAPVRPFVDEDSRRGSTETAAKPKAAGQSRPPAKRVEVSVLPPPRPAEAPAPAAAASSGPAAPPAPAKEPSFIRKTLGFDLPDVVELAPSPKEVGEQAAELARRVGSSVAKIF